MLYNHDTIELISNLRDLRETAKVATAKVENGREKLTTNIIETTVNNWTNEYKENSTFTSFSNYLKACQSELMAETDEKEVSLQNVITLSITVISKGLTKATYKQMLSVAKYAKFINWTLAKTDLKIELVNAKKLFEIDAKSNYLDFEAMTISEIEKLQLALSIIKSDKVKIAKKAK